MEPALPPALRRLLPAALVLTLGAVGTAAAQPLPPPTPEAATAGAGELVRALLGPVPPSASPSSDGRARLQAVVEELALSLGVPLQGEPAAASRALPSQAAGVLADVLAAALVCRQATASALPEGLPVPVQGVLAPLPAERVRDLRRCAADLDAVVRAAAPALRDGLGAGSEVDLWPVLRVARGDRDDVHRHDYAVLVDEGGDDLHLGAAGSNMLDLQRGPAQAEPARGCEQVFPDATTGRVRRGPDGRRTLAAPDQWRPECVAAVGVLLDLAGDDRYGDLVEPGFPDDQCTRDRLVRRIATQGVGFAGVGLLHDAAGRDSYTGKTLTQGAGHLGGIGVLRDEGGGDDRYLALRSAQGIGLLGGLGLLLDDGGDDDHDFYLPRPLDPQAPPQADGSGGVNDDTGLGSEAGLGQHRDEEGRLDGEPGGSCDGIARSVQGVGLLGGIGLLVDRSGDDSYRAAPRAEQEFVRPLDGPVAVHFVHGSQGSGLFGGIGGLWDDAGSDRYLEGHRPSPSRADGVLLVPAWQPDEYPAAGGSVEARLFVDRE